MLYHCVALLEIIPDLFHMLCPCSAVLEIIPDLQNPLVEMLSHLKMKPAKLMKYFKSQQYMQYACLIVNLSRRVK